MLTDRRVQRVAGAAASVVAVVSLAACGPSSQTAGPLAADEVPPVAAAGALTPTVPPPGKGCYTASVEYFLSSAAPPPLTNMFTRLELKDSAFVGRVTAKKEGRFGNSGNRGPSPDSADEFNIYTPYTVAVIDPWLGDALGEIEVLVHGGSVGCHEQTAAYRGLTVGGLGVFTTTPPPYAGATSPGVDLFMPLIEGRAVFAQPPSSVLARQPSSFEVALDPRPAAVTNFERKSVTGTSVDLPALRVLARRVAPSALVRSQ